MSLCECPQNLLTEMIWTSVDSISGHVEPGRTIVGSGQYMRLRWNSTTLSNIAGWHISVFEQ